MSKETVGLIKTAIAAVLAALLGSGVIPPEHAGWLTAIF